jgi:GT2 family glycosyltransferase
MECIDRQTVSPTKVILIDSGSNDPSYLEKYKQQPHVEVVLADKDIGFCKGNNIGMTKLPQHCDFVFLLNPDAFLSSTFLEQALAFMNAPENARYAALTGTVLGYDINQDAPTGAYDSTGVFRTWYGKWYDRDQGRQKKEDDYTNPETIPAICGAVFFCRKKAIDEVLLRGYELLDTTFYMYKEDIDLSLRLRKKGWNLAFVPNMIVYHCRGWQRDRKKMERRFRLASARNELRIQWHQKEPLPIAYSLMKFAVVKVLDM